MAETEPSAGAASPFPGGYIGRGSKVNGRFLFEGATTIDGEISGDIQVHGHLIVGEHALVKAKIVTTSALVMGKVTGDVLAEKKLEIQPPGTLLGDVTTPNLVIGDGAIFEGNSYMKREQKEGKVLPLLRPASTPGSTEAPDSDL